MIRVTPTDETDIYVEKRDDGLWLVLTPVTVETSAATTTGERVEVLQHPDIAKGA